MREIKFRVWDKGTTRNASMFNISGFVLHGSEYRIWYEFKYDGQTQIFNRSYSKRDLILMQYTGLKDNNGKEIYEGDVVKETWRVEPCLVGFDYGQFALCSPDGTYYTELYSQDMDENLEIIGNIYENPELLKDETI
jgi:uncharacterized phage protein (TIGR01671 family)